jgi:hypothetical protein
MNYNVNEMEVALKLKQLEKRKAWIELSLWPPTGNTTIEKQDNRMYINEGRDGKWEGISEAFYNNMVMIYDSRDKNK